MEKKLENFRKKIPTFFQNFGGVGHLQNFIFYSKNDFELKKKVEKLKNFKKSRQPLKFHFYSKKWFLNGEKNKNKNKFF